MTLFELASRHIGIKEKEGEADHPLIRWWHSLCTIGESPDSVPWCSSFVNGMCWTLRRDRSKSAAARSWLAHGEAVDPDDAQLGDIVILSRGRNPRSGHVGFFAGWDRGSVRLLGGNQGDAVNIAPFAKTRILGIRRV
jgi:uncharacterized protein (TIGR02594 family)